MSTFSGPSSFTARKASFSQASSTSPRPRCTKVLVAPRAPESSTGTRLINSVTKARAFTCAAATAVGLGGVVQLRQVAELALQGPGPGGEVVPARAARRLRVRRDHLHARLEQVAPVADPLGVPLAHQEDDGRGVGRAVVGQALLPVGGQQLALVGDGVDVVGEREGDDIGLAGRRSPRAPACRRRRATCRCAPSRRSAASSARRTPRCSRGRTRGWGRRRRSAG